MKNKSLLLLFISFLFVACSKPLPSEKLAYAGEWQSKEMYLLILPDGTVSYQRLKNGGSSSVNGPLKEFVGDNFVVGVAFMTTTFEVSQPPTQVGDQWTMTVDGVRLVKTAE
jgi:hypothetical protein